MAKRSKRRSPASTRGISEAAASKPRLPVKPSSGINRDWPLGLTLIIAVILAYSPVWWAGYIWDDDVALTANPIIIGPLGLKEIWTTSVVKFCPLVFTTFWIEHALWGLAPLPFHLVNVLLHAVSAVLLWRVLQRLAIPGAWLGAALWALHPVQVESVAWVSEMKNTESGVFFLLTILFFVRSIKMRERPGPHAFNWDDGLTLLCAFLALAAKSSTVILPLVLALIAWWIRGRLLSSDLVRLAPILLLSIVASALTIWNPHPEQTFANQWPLTWPQRCVEAGDAIWFYLGKLLWPYPLIMVYPRGPIDAGQWFAYLPALAVLILLLVFWSTRQSWSRPWFFAFAYFTAALLPVLGLVDMNYSRFALVADHFQYLASMGPLALAGAGITRLADLIRPPKTMLIAGLGAGLALVLGFLSWDRAWVYESETALWTDTLAKSTDSWIAYSNLAEVNLQAGQYDKAIAQYQQALAINPGYPEALANLGVIFFQRNQLDEAIDQYQKALAINPYYAEAHNNLGNAFLLKGQVDEAMPQYLKALEIKPTYAQARVNLGVALLQKGQIDEAIANYRAALEDDPNYINAHLNLGNALLQEGQVDQAIVQYRKALEIDPNHPEAHNLLGQALMKSGQVKEAILQFQTALQLRPGYTEAQANLVKAQASPP